LLQIVYGQSYRLSVSTHANALPLIDFRGLSIAR